MATVTHLFAGITDYFKAYGAKSYGEVLENANKRFNPTEILAKRDSQVDAFKNSLSENANLTEPQIKDMLAGNTARHAIGDFIESAFGTVGQVSSVVGGTIGYGTKVAAVAASKGVVPVGKAVGIGAAVTGAVAAAPIAAAGIGAAKSYRYFKNKITSEFAGNSTPMPRPDGKLGQRLLSNTGGAIADMGKQMGRDAWKGANWFHDNRNSRGMTMAAGAGAIALMSTAHDYGVAEEKHNHKLRQIASNMSTSNDGGGTFLTPTHSPQVEDMGASGELVFALRSLRNGG